MERFLESGSRIVGRVEVNFTVYCGGYCACDETCVACHSRAKSCFHPPGHCGASFTPAMPSISANPKFHGPIHRGSQDAGRNDHTDRDQCYCEPRTLQRYSTYCTVHFLPSLALAVNRTHRVHDERAPDGLPRRNNWSQHCPVHVLHQQRPVTASSKGLTEF
ncbi:hypothetical protein VTK56DRAFT_2536 [Thermocarpiscus australiensis]